MQSRPNMEMRATIMRCRCGLEEYEPGHQCPKGKKQRLLLAYSNKNLIKHLFFNAVIKIQELQRRRSISQRSLQPQGRE